MGQIATRVNRDNGKIIGVIPRFMKEENWHHESIKKLIVVNSMHERKETILNQSEALIAFPGGCGTVEELMEAITWKQLGLYTGPIIILNTKGYYDPLLTFLEKMINESFLREVHRNMWSVIENPSEIMSAIRKSPPWSVKARNFAAVK
ncbi:putative cytokinin riboside 5'-monophosphate phosphoribohydrolase [subsurface metagenome]